MSSQKLSPKQYKELIKISIASAYIQQYGDKAYTIKYPNWAEAARREDKRHVTFLWNLLWKTVHPQVVKK